MTDKNQNIASFLFSLLLVVTFSFPLFSQGQTYKTLIEEADRIQGSGRFEDAIRKFREAEAACRKEAGFYNSDLSYILMSIAACCQSTDDYDTYVDCLVQADSIGKKIGYDKDVTEEFLCYELAKAFIRVDVPDDLLQKGKDYLQRGLRIADANGNKDNRELWEVQEHRLKYVEAAGMTDLEKAAPILKSEYDYFTKISPFPKDEMFWDIENIGILWAGNLRDRINNEESLKILDSTEAILKSVDSDYYSLDYDAGRMYALANMAADDKCISLGEKILRDNKEIEENFELISSVKYNLGRGYNGAGRFQEGWNMLKSIYESPLSYFFEGRNTDFVKSEMAYSLLGLGRNDESKSLCEEILSRNPEGAAKAQAYYVLGEIAKVKSDKSELGYMDDYMDAHGELGYDGDGYAESLIGFSRRYLDLYQYQKALELINMAVDKFESEGKTASIDYFVALSVQALICVQMEDVEGMGHAMTKIQKNGEVIKSLVVKEEDDVVVPDYEKGTYFLENFIMSLYYGFNVSTYFFNQGIRSGEIDEAQKAAALNTINSVFGQLSQLVATVVEDEGLHDWLKKNNPGRLGLLHHVKALAMRDIEDYDGALKYIDVAKRDLPADSQEVDILDELANYIRIRQNVTGMTDFIKNRYDVHIGQLKEMLNSFTSAARGNMWQQYYGNISNYVEYAHKGGNNPNLNKIAYNSILVSKGLMLQADIDFETRILRSNDVKILDKYNEWKTESANASGRAHAIERELVRMVGPAEESESFRYSWEDIRKRLKKGEYALEFRSYDDYGVGRYLGFLLGPDYSSPILVEVCSSKELSDVGTGDNFAFNSLSSIVWSKFDKLIPPGSTVFFSPDMQLHSFPLENLPDYFENGKSIGDRWNLHRLSSTRQIVQNQEGGRRSGVEIFGGIDYSLDPQELLADYNENMSRYRAYSEDSENLRAGITRVRSLPGSKREVAEIARVLKGNDTPVREFTGKTGTEARFKASAGKNGNVLHISTHGFFLNPSNVGGRLANLLSLSGKQSLSYDDALTGSGLMMAGVNEVITGKVSTDECEDGLLTSKEISRMDLSNIDFAVLSACETGVGAVSGEGVFGLQRGFKLAGVNSIMMSLWKVDDDATEKLMTEFYRSWVGTRDSRKALKIAQEAVRKTPGWEHPKYWAGFILLD